MELVPEPVGVWDPAEQGEAVVSAGQPFSAEGRAFPGVSGAVGEIHGEQHLTPHTLELTPQWIRRMKRPLSRMKCAPSRHI